LEKLKLAYRTDKESITGKKDVRLNYAGQADKWKKFVSKRELDGIDGAIEDVLSEAIEFARNSSLPEPEDALKTCMLTEFDGLPDSGTVSFKRNWWYWWNEILVVPKWAWVQLNWNYEWKIKEGDFVRSASL